jgi:NADP-dependent 3-hydroxy acid dehydrogenase YdfG
MVDRPAFLGAFRATTRSMAKTIVICGYGPGISDAVARKYGSEGWQLALVSRSPTKVADAAAVLCAEGLVARGFACDLGDLDGVSATMRSVRADMGPATAIHWNAYSPLAGDLVTCDPAELRTAVDVTVTGLLAAVQAALEDLRAQPDAAVLVTGGGFGLVDPNIDSTVARLGMMGLGLTKALQHKLVGLLHARLRDEGIYVGEVMVLGIVKGTAFDRGQGTIDPHAVAARFWDIHQRRTDVSVQIG